MFVCVCTHLCLSFLCVLQHPWSQKPGEGRVSSWKCLWDHQVSVIDYKTHTCDSVGGICLSMPHTLMDRWLLLCVMSQAFLWLAGGLGCWIITNMIGLRYLFHFFCFCRWLRENHRRSWPRFCRWQSRQCIRTKRSVWLEITFALFSLSLSFNSSNHSVHVCVVALRSGFVLRLQLLWHFKPQRLFYLCMRYTSY